MTDFNKLINDGLSNEGSLEDILNSVKKAILNDTIKADARKWASNAKATMAKYLTRPLADQIPPSSIELAEFCVASQWTEDSTWTVEDMDLGAKYINEYLTNMLQTIGKSSEEVSKILGKALDKEFSELINELLKASGKKKQEKKDRGSAEDILAEWIKNL